MTMAIQTRGRLYGKALPALVIVQAVIAALALAVMVYVALQINPLLKEKARLESEIGSLRSELSNTQRELEAARQQLAETFDMARYEHELDPVDMKSISSRYPRPAQALRLMDRLRRQGVGWYLGGRSPEQGFDSPGFAAYVLGELDVLEFAARPGEDLISTSRRLFQIMPPVNDPGVGDLVFYPAGYVLFYFVDDTGESFVIGMTPSGITALEPDFATPIGYRRSGLGG